MLSVVDWHTLEGMQEVMDNLEVIMTHVCMHDRSKAMEKLIKLYNKMNFNSSTPFTRKITFSNKRITFLTENVVNMGELEPPLYAMHVPFPKSSTACFM